MEASQNRRFYEKMECLLLWPLGEHIGNLKGTYWDQRINEKNPPPPPKLKRKKIKALLSAC
jgi:hypothetical protein